MKQIVVCLFLFCVCAPAWSQQPTGPFKYGDKPDLKFFEAFVQPVFRDVCSSCHAQNGNLAFGRFPQQQSFGSPYTDEQTQRNFEEAVRRIRFKEPNGSLLLNKPLAKVGHVGGQQMREGGKDQKAFTDWINGAIATGPVGGAAGGALDQAFFEVRVQPILGKGCALRGNCHGGTVGGGAQFHLEPPTGDKFPPDVTKANFEQTAKKVKPKDANGSPLVRKPTGDLLHGGGIRLDKTSPDFAVIVEWINGGKMAGAGGLDRAFFDQFVNPIISRTCGVSTCHGGTDGIGARFHITAPGPNGRFEPKQLDDNFLAVMNPARPRAALNDMNSLILAKPSGVITHGGGLKLPRNSREFETIASWVNGAKARPNRPPVVALTGANVIEQRVGTPATIDLSATKDPDDDPVKFTYKVVMAPRGGAAEVRGAGPRPTIIANRPGAYVVAVTASDGKPGGDSDPYNLTVIITGEAAADDPSVVGPRTIPAAKGTLPESRRELFVRRVYFDILGRGPNPEEFTAALTIPRERLVSGLFNRPEYHRSWLEEQFQFLGLTGAYRYSPDWISVRSLGLFNRDSRQIDVLYYMLTDSSYRDRNFGRVNLQNFLAVVSEQLVGRAPTTDELNKPDIIGGFMQSREFHSRWIGRMYRRLVGSDCPPELASKLAERLGQFPAASAAIEQEIVESLDYLAAMARPKPKTPAMLADSLIRDLLGRAPNDSEFDAARTAIASSQDHSAIALLIGRGLLASSEAKTPNKSAVNDRPQWVREQFIRFLRREPTAKELTAFSEAMNDAQTTPRLIIEALISSQEYTLY